MTPLQDQLTRARCWTAWYLGGLRVSGDFLETAEQLRVLYVELARLATTRALAERALSEGWSWIEGGPLSTREELFDLWQAREQVPCRSLLEMLAHVGSLYLLCVEGRLPKEPALSLEALWTAPWQVMTARPGSNCPGGEA